MPLGVAIGGYAVAWTGWRDGFRADLARVLSGAEPAIGGFPYRMAATVAGPKLALRAPGTVLDATGTRAVVNRGPWRDDLHVVGVDALRLSAGAGLAGARLRVEAAEALGSLRTAGPGLRRLSLTVRDARVMLGLLPAAVRAATMEAHLRPSGTPGSYEIVLAGASVRVGAGAPLTLAATLRMTGGASLDAWRRGGTLRIAPLTLGDASGEVLRIEGAVVPAGEALRVSGTVATVCPATLRAAFAGEPARTEKRTRRPVTMTLGGTAGRYTLSPPALDAMRLARREQLPACPVLG